MALMKCLQAQFYDAVAPRLFLIVFRYCQPVLIEESIRFILTYPDDMDDNRGFWLVVATIAIYVGLAVCIAKFAPDARK